MISENRANGQARRNEAVHWQFFVFTAVGAIGTAVHYVLLVYLVQAWGTDPVPATSAGAFAGACVNYVLNYRFTFRSDHPHLQTAPRFFFLAATGLGLNAALMAAGVAFLRWHYLVVQVFATAAVLLWNFAGNRLWTFRRGKHE